MRAARSVCSSRCFRCVVTRAGTASNVQPPTTHPPLSQQPICTCVKVLSRPLQTRCEPPPPTLMRIACCCVLYAVCCRGSVATHLLLLDCSATKTKRAHAHTCTQNRAPPHRHARAARRRLAARRRRSSRRRSRSRARRSPPRLSSPATAPRGCRTGSSRRTARRRFLIRSGRSIPSDWLMVANVLAGRESLFEARPGAGAAAGPAAASTRRQQQRRGKGEGGGAG